MSGIFQQSVLKRFSQDESIVALRWAKLQVYKAKMDFIKTVKEEKYQDGFLHDIFEECLGYTLDNTNPQNFNLEREKKNETDGKKADGAIFVDGKVVGVIELKAQDTKNLDKAVDQAFGYLVSNANARYVIVSNFDELRFYIEKATAYEKFHLFTLDYEGFKKLHLILSYESIKEDVPLQLKEKSTTFEQQISKELYKDFSAFRNRLFENIVKNNETDKSTLLRLTQKLCDRIIFILFAEDRGLLNPNTIKEIRTRHAGDIMGNPMYGYYKIYFDAINQGNEKLNIPKYNGGLFAPDTLLESLIIDDECLDMEAQKLSDYDFESEVGVNILGHIFEQSLTDLEELNASINDTDFDKKKSKRKKDGVFYTPEYITRYIVQNTLGKLCEDKKAELGIGSEVLTLLNPKKLTKAELTYKENLLSYREWLTNLKILDPACGSGAFLNQALEFLIKEHTVARDMLLPFGDLTIGYEIETSILEHNLYGVDINEDAVEIARLSLWLRTAHRGRALTNLSQKIVCANSLLDMPFPEGSFDVVIGNPPYVRQEAIKEQKEALSKIYKVANGTADLYVYFYELGIRMLKPNGLKGFICSNKFFRAKYGENLRKYILENTTIKEIADFNGVKVFEDATVDSAITILEKQKPDEHHKFKVVQPCEIMDCQKTVIPAASSVIPAAASVIPAKAGIHSMDPRVKHEDDMLSKSIFMKQSDLNKSSFSFSSPKELIIKQKIEAIGTPLKEWDINIFRGILTGFNEAFIIDGTKKDELISKDRKSAEIIKPLLRGRNLEKYSCDSIDEYLITTHNNPPVNIEDYPAIKEHLNKFIEKLITRYDKGQTPYNLRNCKYLNSFEKSKIIYPEFSSSSLFSYDDKGAYLLDTSWFIDSGDKYLLALLNSKIIWHYLGYISSSLGSASLRMKKIFVQQIPIPKIDEEKQQPFIKLVDEILESKQKLKDYKILLDEAMKSNNFDREIKLKKEIEILETRVMACENEIDTMVYKLYDLTEDEIAIVEGS